jgi:hypothetical protein
MSVVGLTCAVLYAHLAYRSQAYGQAELFDLGLICGLAALLSFGLWFYYHKSHQAVPLAQLLFWAALFRVIGIFGYPVLEDDYFRYLWDGYMLVEHGSPYAIPPSMFFDDSTLADAFQVILGYINYPDIATVYGPVSQWSFGLAYYMAPAEVWPLQFLYGLADFLIVLALTRLAKAKTVILYAFSPLLIKEFSFSAHVDVLAVLFVVLALWSFIKQHYLVMAALLALAVGSKIFAIIIAPLLLGLRLKAWCIFGLVLVAITAAYFPSNPWLTGGLGAMTDIWLFNAPFYLMLDYFQSLAVAPESIPLTAITQGPLSWWTLSVASKFLLLAIFSGIWCLYLFHYLSRERKSSVAQLPRGDWLFGLFFLCSPVVNPWYLVWILPFATIYPSYWAWVASVSVLLSYAVGINLLNSDLDLYQQPAALVILEYALIFIAVIVDLKFRNNFVPSRK